MRQHTTTHFVLTGLAAAALAAGLAGAPAAAGAQDARNHASAEQRSPEKQRVSLNVNNADIRIALKLLFDAARANYTLDQAVQGTVTASLKDVPFKTALESLLRANSGSVPLGYRVQDGVYNIAPTAAAPKEYSQDETLIVQVAKEPSKKYARIQLNYADPADVARACGGTVFQTRFGPGAGIVDANRALNGGFGQSSGFGTGMGSGFGSGFGFGMSGGGTFGLLGNFNTGFSGGSSFGAGSPGAGTGSNSGGGSGR